MLGILMALYFITTFWGGLCRAEDELLEPGCDIFIYQSCSFLLQVNQSSLQVIDDDCKLFQNGILMNQSLLGLLSSTKYYKGYLRVCADDMIIDLSNAFANIPSEITGSTKPSRRNSDGGDAQSDCNRPLAVVWDDFFSHRHLDISGLSPNKLKRNSRHVNNQIKNRYERRANRSRNVRMLLDIQARQCRRIQGVFASKRQIFSKSSRRDKVRKNLRRILKKLRRQCTRINKKRNQRQVNRTEVSQLARSGRRPRKQRSVTTNKWIKSIQICINQDFNESLTLKMISKHEAYVDMPKFPQFLSLSGDPERLSLDIRWYQNYSISSNEIVFQFSVPINQSNLTSQGVDADDFLKRSPTSMGVTGKPTESHDTEDNNHPLIIVIIILVALMLIIIFAVVYFRNCHNSSARTSVDDAQGSGDTFSERSSFDDSHEMADEISPGKAGKRYMKTLCHHKENQRNREMPTCQNNNRSSTHKNRNSKSGSRRNPKSSEYNSANQSERSYLSSRTNELSCSESFTHASGASNRNAPACFKKYNRFNNNPHRTGGYLTKEQLASVSYPPLVRRFPSGVDNYKRICVDSNRFQTPPNRSLLQNDGDKIETCFLGQNYIQIEPSSCASTNSDISPPSYSPRSGSSQSQGYTPLNREQTFANYDTDPPPEYSEPPSY